MTIQNHTPQSAYDFLSQNPNAILIDVRTKEEHQFVGIPNVTNIALIPVKTLPLFSVNTNFVAEVVACSNVNLETPLLLLCRSGVRSLFAGELLLQYGFKNVYNIQYGFEGDLDDNKQRSIKNGWKFDNLPWKQS